MTNYSGRTSAFEHKKENWAEFKGPIPPAIQMNPEFYVQHTDCPIEVYEEVVKLWKDLELRNNSSFWWDREELTWNDTPNYEDYPLIDEYLMARGISKISINFWW